MLPARAATGAIFESSQALVGNGAHDDTAAIQSLLDSRRSTIYLPPPTGCYLISKCLRIHSNQSLVLDRFTIVRLAPGSDCLMLTNEDHRGGNLNIAVSGGIWDMDCRQQAPNPLMYLCVNKEDRTPYDPERYLGICMRFVGVKHFSLQAITFRDPVTFCTQFARLHYFTIDDITFDFQHWNPKPHNMDGIHLDGGCRFGRITNLKGATYDDLLAINADDVEAESPGVGPIEDISVDGIYAADCQSAVRLLSAGSPLRRITITNVFATCYLYGIGITRYFRNRTEESCFEDITLRNIHLSKAPRYPHYLRDKSPDFPLLWFEKGVRVRNLTIDGFHRQKGAGAAPSIKIEMGATVDHLQIRDYSESNESDGPIDSLVNEGTIGNLYLDSHVSADGPVGGELINRGNFSPLGVSK